MASSDALTTTADPTGGQSVTVRLQDPEPLQALIPNVVTQAQTLEVVDEQSHTQGQEILQAEAQLRRQVIEFWKEPKTLAHQLHKSLTTRENAMLAPLDVAKSMLTRKLTTYARAAADKAAAEQKRLQEQARLEEEQRRIMDADAAEEQGDTEVAEQIRSAPPAPAPVIHVEPELTKTPGVVTTKRWKAEVVDLVKLAAFVAANPNWVGLIEPNMPNLNRMAVAQRENLSIPGVKAVVTESIAVRSAVDPL